MEYIHLGRFEQARETLAKYRAAGLAEHPEMVWSIQFLVSRSSSASTDPRTGKGDTVQLRTGLRG